MPFLMNFNGEDESIYSAYAYNQIMATNLFLYLLLGIHIIRGKVLV